MQFSNVQMTSVADLLMYAGRAQVPGLRQAHGDLCVNPYPANVENMVSS